MKQASAVEDVESQESDRRSNGSSNKISQDASKWALDVIEKNETQNNTKSIPIIPVGYSDINAVNGSAAVGVIGRRSWGGFNQPTNIRVS